MENRKQIITVATSKLNTYGDLEFTDTEGNSYKVGKARVNHFEVIQEGAEVILEWAVNPHKKDSEYIYSAIQTGTHYSPEMLPNPSPKALGLKSSPPKPEDGHLVGAAEKMGFVKEKSDKMSKEDWAEKDEKTRRSIQRQTALKTAAENAPEKTTTEDIIKVAKRYDKYLETGE